jgi:hypothetical protein
LPLASELGRALDEDSRVTRVEVPEDLDPAWSPVFRAYPAMTDMSDQTGVHARTRHFHVQRISLPIKLWIHVPEKNQPVTHADDLIPTEDYYALWNGQTLIVAWEIERAAKFGWGGGHVVADVIEKAAKRSGCDIYVQACSRHCEHMFIHTDVLLEMVDEGPRWEPSKTKSRLVLQVKARGDSSVEAAASTAWRNLRNSIEDFAFMKNAARNVLDLENVIRFDLDDLTEMHLEAARRASLPWAPPWRESWRPKRWGLTRGIQQYRSRHWRRAARILLAQLWLALASLEFVTRRWSSEGVRFRRSSEEARVSALFELDEIVDGTAVRELDTSLMEKAVSHAADRLDNTATAWATFGGAIAGGVVAIVIVLLTT